ncbi:hypothetical protein GCM10027567_30740 [Spongiibacter taiwanensis]
MQALQQSDALCLQKSRSEDDQESPPQDGSLNSLGTQFSSARAANPLVGGETPLSLASADFLRPAPRAPPLAFPQHPVTAGTL